MRFEHAKLTLAGHRPENQDKVEALVHGESALIVAVDGMGGHAEGAKASELTVETLRKCFEEAGQPVFDPQGFLTRALALAHERVVEAGSVIAMEQRPRATCAVCLVQDDSAYWAHVGDSRMYQLRAGAVLHRSRDHSHVELLLNEGLIGEEEVRNHPMRNYVECCLGGDVPLPDMSIAERIRVASGDVLLACTDGFWSGNDDEEIGALASGSEELGIGLRRLADQAVARNAPHSDNTSVAALRCLPE